MKVRDKLTQATWYQGGWGVDRRGLPVKNLTDSRDRDDNCCLNQMCLKTAIFLNPGESYADKQWRVCNAIKKLYPDRYPENSYKCPLAAFNDHKDTRWEDVARVLEEANV